MGHLRAQRGNAAQMPPLGTTEVNPAGQALVRGWIEQLGSHAVRRK